MWRLCDCVWSCGCASEEKGRRRRLNGEDAFDAEAKMKVR